MLNIFYKILTFSKKFLEPQPRRENDTQMSADYMVDTPVADKQTKQLGSKSDIDTKRMLKWLVIGLGAIAGVIVAILVFRVS